jgi:hypothetical protein
VFPDRFGSYLYWAVLPVQIASAKSNAPRTKRFEAVIDSGATRCLFHANLASSLGIDLRSGISEITNGIGGREETWVHDLLLYIPGGPVQIQASFKENLPIAGLLGTNGFFEHFDVTFEGRARQCILERLN